MEHVSHAWALAAVALTITGCSVGGKTTGRPCTGGKCPAGLVCVNDACVAGSADGGTPDGGSCDPSACTAPAHGTATCDGGTCGFTCNTGYHACGSACADDTSPDTCGTSCTACSPPANATATCTSGACGFTCGSGYHACGSTCADDTDPATCGTSCTACPAPANGSATCDGTSCGIQCSTGYHACAGACVPDASTSACGASCTACTAPPNGTVACVSGACQITCPQGQTACGNQCVDLATDAASCGACAHDCLGTACQGGVCQPTVLAQGEFDPNKIAVDDTNVYWCTASGGNPRGADYIRMVAKNGGTPSDLAQSSCEGIASDGTNVYWTKTGGIFEAPRSGGPATTFATVSPYPDDVIIGATNVYWDRQQSPPAVGSTPIGGGSNYVVATLGDAATYELGYDDHQVCWADHAAGVIACYSSVTGQTRTLASGQTNPTNVTAAAGYVYWETSDGTVARAALTGSSGPQVLATGLTDPYELAVGKYVYVACGTTSATGVGQIIRVPLTGGTPRVVAASQARPYGIATDATFVYWTDVGANNTADGTIMRETQ